MKVLLAIVLGLCLGDPAVARPPSLLSSLAQPKTYVPAPRQYSVITGQIDPNLNGDGQVVGAYADAANNTVHVQPDPSEFAVGHELGHLFDSQILGDGDRNFFTRLMHAPSGPWDRGAATGKVDGLRSPNEWFSDYYGAMASGMDPEHDSIGSFATITPKRLKRFEAAMTRLGRRQNLAGLNLLETLASAR